MGCPTGHFLLAPTPFVAMRFARCLWATLRRKVWGLAPSIVEVSASGVALFLLFGRIGFTPYTNCGIGFCEVSDEVHDIAAIYPTVSEHYLTYVRDTLRHTTIGVGVYVL